MSYETVQLLKEFWFKWRSSRVLILFIVFVALFLDNMLLTTVGKFNRFCWKFIINVFVFIIFSF